MAIRHIIGSGIGFSPGSVKFIITRGLSSASILTSQSFLSIKIDSELNRSLMSTGNVLSLDETKGKPLSAPSGNKGFTYHLISNALKLHAWTGTSWTDAFRVATILAENSITIGIGAPNTDYTLTFDGETNDGVITWMEDEDYFQFQDDIKISDGENIVLDTTAGTKIGTTTSQKLGFFNATPVIQPNGTGETTGFTAGIGTSVNDDSTFTGNVGSTAYRINDIVKALKNLGVLAE